VALDHLRSAYELTVDPVERARIAVPLVRSLLFLGPPGEAAAITERSAAALGPDHGDLRRQLEALRLAVALFDPAIVPLDDPAFARHRGPLVADGLGARMLAGVAAYQWAMSGGPVEECVDLALRAVEDGTLLAGDNGGVPHAAALIVLIVADRDEAVHGLDASLASAHRNGSIFEAAFAYTFRGLAYLLRGDLVEAEKLLRTHVEMYADWGFETVQMFPYSYISDTLVERGDIDGARAALGKIHLPPEIPAASGLSWTFAARLRTLVAAGAHENAVALADDYAHRFLPWIDNPAWVPWRSLKAEALWRLGRRDEAVELAAAEVELARHCAGPRVLGRALRVLGTASGEGGMEHLDEAVAVLEGSPARLELAKALAARGTALRIARRPTEAREPLRRALELASACEATPLVEAVKTELYATGARPRTEALSGAAALTASERRVATLAAEGQTNRDIAQALYVTPKTVEVHLSSAYRKLGIRSRRELAPALLA
jgi:DNA-binding CsgD family transcriptional regulator